MAAELERIHSGSISKNTKLNSQNIYAFQDEASSVSHSVSNISQDDMGSAMNYLGQQMSTTLFKGIHELPIPLRKEETLLRAVEVLLTNLLQEKFDDPHVVLN